MISANNSWVLCFDNLSKIPPWLSDAMCRLATGGGFSARALYTDQDEVLFDAQRPILLNGIEELESRGDLLERSLILYLPSIPEDRRRRETTLLREFELSRAKILRALLVVVSGGLHELPGVELNRLPRMADFATWGAAIEKALDWTEASFLDAYLRNQDAANDLALEASTLGPSVLNFALDHGIWQHDG